MCTKTDHLAFCSEHPSKSLGNAPVHTCPADKEEQKKHREKAESSGHPPIPGHTVAEGEKLDSSHQQTLVKPILVGVQRGSKGAAGQTKGWKRGIGT